MCIKKIARHVLVVGLSTILGLTGAMKSYSQISEYYYVGDKKITLTVSEKFKAFSMKSSISPSTIRGFEANVEAEGVGSVQHSPILEKYGVMLIRSKANVAASAFRSGMESLGTHDEVETEIPVYAIGNTSAVLVNEFLVQFRSDISELTITTFLKDHQAKIVSRHTKIPNRYTITFEGKSPKDALALSNQMHQHSLVKFSEPSLIEIIPARPEIKSSELSSAVPSPSATTSNDPLLSQQWGLHNSGNGNGIAGADIDALEAWDLTTGSESIIVAIIDEGTDTLHPDLRDRIISPYDATDGDNDQQPQICAGHGTSCAGIAAATGNNSLGMAGVSWHVKIMPIRIATIDDCSLPSNQQSWLTSNAIIEDGIRTAVDRGAHVLSNSWGGGSPSNAINSAIDYAISQNRVVVIAAGNDSGPVSYPADLSTTKTIIAVSATNEFDEFKTKTSQDGEHWWGSNFGPEVNISAPGVHIVTTDISGSAGYANGDYVSTFNGTSSATPFVAGAVGLMLSQNPAMTPEQVRDRLQATADDRGAAGFDNQFGHGRLNVAKALADPEPVTTPNVVDQLQTDAQETLLGLGLTVGSLTKEHHPTITKDHVMSQTPTAGTEVIAGSAVNLVISLGPNNEGSRKIPLVPVIKGAITASNKENHFHFIVEESGSYTVETQGSTDTYMSLFGPNSETTLLEENDDIEIGKNSNSRIIRNLNPGTYHVTIRHYSSSGQGEFTITVQSE